MCGKAAKILIYSVKHFQIHGTAVDRQVVAKAFSNKMLLNCSQDQEKEFQHPRGRGASSLKLHHLNDIKKILGQDRMGCVRSGGHKALSPMC